MKEAEKTPETLRFSGVFLVPYYTIPKIKRELKQNSINTKSPMHYTMPKIKRELKHHHSLRGIRETDFHLRGIAEREPRAI